MKMKNGNAQQLPVAVLGAGPVGLAAAAHLIERGLTPLVLEAGHTIGANPATYRHVRLFSSWQYNIDKAARRLLHSHAWMAPADDALPTAGELLDHYLAPLAATPGIAASLLLGRRVMVVGAGHSAAGALLALARLAEEHPGTRIVWATRGSQLARVFGGGAADGLKARGELGMRLKALRDAGGLEMRQDFRIEQLIETGGKMRVVGEAVDGAVPAIDDIDRIVCAAGARPDLALTRELRVRHDPWLESTDALAPLIDPNEHSCGTVRSHGHRELAHPEPGYYAVGAKSYGRAPNFLMATGYEQVRSVVAALVGDMAAADDVQLELPETGVCHTRLAYDTAAEPASSCCNVPAAAAASCCVPAPSTEGACGCSKPAESSCCA
jgi:hypothetical protein